MNNLVEVVGLGPLVERAGRTFRSEKNFEAIYSRLASEPKHEDLLEKVEKRIRDYFESLEMPTETTLYDRLLLSLRRKDAIFTFNWDPFLFDAYKRNFHVAKLPEIFFLHGNVRIGMCQDHPMKWGERRLQCPICSRPFSDVPLLYPIEHKNYSSHPFIKESWKAARYFLSESFVLTIFGYGAPASDIDAVELLRLAWMQRSDRKIEHVELINTDSYSSLYERWKEFTPTSHLKIKPCFEDSWIAMYP